MQTCPKCKFQFKSKFEEIISFDVFGEWRQYIAKHMKNAIIYKMGKKTSVQSGNRVLAEWDGENYGFVSEGRTNHLKRISYRG